MRVRIYQASLGAGHRLLVIAGASLSLYRLYRLKEKGRRRYNSEDLPAITNDFLFHLLFSLSLRLLAKRGPKRTKDRGPQRFANRQTMRQKRSKQNRGKRVLFGFCLFVCLRYPPGVSLVLFMIRYVFYASLFVSRSKPNVA